MAQGWTSIWTMASAPWPAMLIVFIVARRLGLKTLQTDVESGFETLHPRSASPAELGPKVT